MRFSVRPLATEDVPVLLEMIRELATFERLEHEVRATVRSLRQCFFGRTPVAGALLARRGKVVVGYATYYFTFSSFVGRPGMWLDDLYVRPEYRQHGLGRALINAVARIAAKRNCGRYEWMALNWNKTALEFYERLGARRMGDWVLLRMDTHGLQRMVRKESKG